MNKKFPSSRFNLHYVLSAIIIAIILPLNASADFAPQSLLVGAKLIYEGNQIFRGEVNGEEPRTTIFSTLSESTAEFELGTVYLDSVGSYSYSKTGPNTATIIHTTTYGLTLDFGFDSKETDNAETQLTFTAAEGGNYSSSGTMHIVTDPAHPRNLTFTESGTFSYSAPIQPCLVGDFSTEHTTAPLFDASKLDPRLQVALSFFTAAVRAAGGDVIPTSGFRSTEYQAHFYEIKKKFDALRAMGVELSSSVPPNLEDSEDFAECNSIIGHVNQEINLHGLGLNKNGRLAVNEKSIHSLGLAVDLKVTLPGGNKALINKLARQNNLWQRYGEGDAVHYELYGVPPLVNLAFGGHSPINILVEDPSGRKIGFDPVSNAVINQIGTNASYSGIGTEPQMIEISPFAFIDGNYKVSGIGNGTGPYTIDVQIEDDENPDAAVITKVLSVGMASTGQPLAVIPLINPNRNTVLISAEREGEGLVFFAPPWVTNAIVQSSTNLAFNTWIDMPQPIDPINGLTLSNLASKATFYRLKLP